MLNQSICEVFISGLLKKMPVLTKDYSTYLRIEIYQDDFSSVETSYDVQVSPFDAERLFKFGWVNMPIAITGQLGASNEIIAEKVIFNITPAPTNLMGGFGRDVVVH